MTNLKDLTTSQLKSIIAIKEEIEALQSAMESIAGGGGGGGEIPIPAAEEAPVPAKKKHHMTTAHRRKLVKALAKARQIRWAKAKASKEDKSKPAKKDRRSSPATRTKLAASAKARWARVRAEGKTKL